MKWVEMDGYKYISMVSVVNTFLVTAGTLVLAAYFAIKRKPVIALVCLGCFLALFQPAVVFAAETCRPHHYPDGDTFHFNNRDGIEVKVRVAGFDAPERGQPFSRVATERMQDLTKAGAQCDCYKFDRYGRSVCNVRTLQGQNVAALMLGAGLGCIDERFENEADPADRRAARSALDEAQRARRGMWSQPDAVCGYDYRRSKNAQR